MLNDILIIVNIILVVGLIIYLVLSYKRMRRNLMLPKIMPTDIASPRERLENIIYDVRQGMPLSIDSEDKNIILINYSGKSYDYTLKTPNDSYYNNLGISLDGVVVNRHTAFCLIPFNKRFSKLFDAIKKGCANAGFDCYKSDTPVEPGSILRQIVNLILKSEIIVGVLDGSNPNVFYEIGLAHSLGKPVFLVVNNQSKGEVPFDLRSDRLIIYNNPQALTEQLSTILKKIKQID